MKATLEFDLSEEKETYLNALNADSYKRVLQEFDQHLRNLSKYYDHETVEIQTLRDHLHYKLDEFEVTLW